ncbi:hypothetical protein DSM112329_05431 [Paraconexibacter sp. AEG42_29]|uniref:Tetratricopeptide repeat protein n=1 Tax=Paraconexibacter sp. AEG42_29 TaxID=2997339 RepID=A0AAU7B3I8_9ACTN
MLFDLRGRGRRRVVQTIYLALAILMGGGLVLFGIGGNTNGGLFDAFSSDNQTVQNTSYSKDIDKVEKRIEVNPKDAAAWARLASLQLAEGGVQGAFDGDKDGLDKFREASRSWDRYTALNPPKTDLSVARQMINVYGSTGLNQPAKAVAVMDVIIDETEPPEADLYKQYAQLAFFASQTRKGDLAIDRAVALSPASDRKSVRSALENLKTQITQAAAQQAAAAAGADAPAATPTEAVPVTPAPTVTTGKATTTGSGSTTTGKTTSTSKGATTTTAP